MHRIGRQLVAEKKAAVHAEAGVSEKQGVGAHQMVGRDLLSILGRFELHFTSIH